MIWALAAIASGTAQHNAEVEMVKCFYGQAYTLDDHVSSAAAVGQGVTSACAREINDWKYDSFLELRPPDAQRFYRSIEQSAQGMATEVVLRVRAATKELGSVTVCEFSGLTT